MAVTSIWPIKGSVAAVIEYARNPEKTREESSVELHKINNVIQYAANELKTEYHTYVNVINLASAETAAEEFMETKRLKDKTGGRQCFHGYQSFRPERWTPKRRMRSVWSWHIVSGVITFRSWSPPTATPGATTRISW